MERNHSISGEGRPILSYRCSLDSPSIDIMKWLSLLLPIIPNFLPVTLSLRLCLRFVLPHPQSLSSSFFHSYVTIPDKLLWKLLSSCEYLKLISCNSPDFTPPSVPQPGIMTTDADRPLCQLKLVHSPHLSIFHSSSSLSFLQFLFRSPHLQLLEIIDSLPKTLTLEFPRILQGMGCCVKDHLSPLQDQRRWIIIRGITSLEVDRSAGGARRRDVLVSPPTE